ncbi:uncharacterized protein LOC142227030 [Haematobia irritans]|uniref:Uncharacterized protein n=1 Tax=Haematobia irritans TaxID=7368 RepID=A0A1L8EGK3_HAEIR
MSTDDLHKPNPLDEVKFAGGRPPNQLQRNLSTKDLQKAFDDVDFTSGFETQYQQEYRPLKPTVTVPKSQLRETLWYRDLKTILMVTFLMGIFLFGTILLTKLVFTTNPLYVFAITSIYVIVAIIMIVLEVKTQHIR